MILFVPIAFFGGAILAFVGVMNWTFYGLGYPGAFLPLLIGGAGFLFGLVTDDGKNPGKDKIWNDVWRDTMKEDKDWQEHNRKQKK